MSIAGLERDWAGLAAQSAKPSKSLHRKLSAQGNASMVGAWTGAASELRGESQRLAGLVTRFKLPEHQRDMPDREPPVVTRDEAPKRSSSAPPRRQLPR